MTPIGLHYLFLKQILWKASATEDLSFIDPEKLVSSAGIPWRSYSIQKSKDCHELFAYKNNYFLVLEFVTSLGLGRWFCH